MLLWTKNSKKDFVRLFNSYTLRRMPKIHTCGFKSFLVEIFSSMQLEQDAKLCLLFRNRYHRSFHSRNAFFFFWQFEMFPEFFHRCIHSNENKTIVIKSYVRYRKRKRRKKKQTFYHNLITEIGEVKVSQRESEFVASTVKDYWEPKKEKSLSLSDRITNSKEL